MTNRLALSIFTLSISLSLPAHSAELCTIQDNTQAGFDILSTGTVIGENGAAKVMIAANEAGEIDCSGKRYDTDMQCLTASKMTVLVDHPDKPLRTVSFNGAEMGELHVYDTGDLSCGAKADFDG